MAKAEKDRLDRVEQVLYGDPQLNFVGLVEHQRRDNEKWDKLERHMTTQNQLLEKLKEQNETHYQMTMHQEERLKKVEIVFYTFGQLSKIKKKTIAVIASVVAFLTTLAVAKEQISEAVQKIFK